MLDVVFTKPALPKSGALVLPVTEEATPSGLWQQADEATGGAITRALAAAEFKGGKGKTCTILAPGAGLSRVVAVGLGKPGELSRLVLERAGGHAAAASGIPLISIFAGAVSERMFQRWRPTGAGRIEIVRAESPNLLATFEASLPRVFL